VTHLDPRSPLVLDTVDLGRRPGAMQQVRRTVPAPAHLGTDVIGIPAGTDIDLRLRLESVMEGVLVSGNVGALALGECVRCLDTVEESLDLTLQELFVYPDKAGHDDDERVLQADLIDLEPVLRDTVVPALPFQPICAPDCPGLCSQCGQRLIDDPTHAHEVLDPRWSALQALTSGEDPAQMKES
jgi:uncharacterized protein